MAEVDPAKTPSLVEHYLLEGKDKTRETTIKPVEEAAGEVKKTVETPAADDSTEVPTATPVVAENTETIEGSNGAAGGESTESVPPVEPTSQDDHAASEEVSESAESDSSADQEAVAEIKLETAPADFRFPTTNQSRHCFTRYIEYHRCIAAKGDDAPECQKFSKYYRSLCPGEWIERWNEQRENGTFPGPL